MTDTLSATETEDFIERASILEYDAHLPRVEAERLARQMVIEGRRLPLTRERGSRS